MKIDTRVFKYAGTSADPDGSFKARFANSPDARPKVLQKAGHTNFVLIPLPAPMTKLDAIKFLQEIKPEGVNQEALAEKAVYIAAQEIKLANIAAGVTKRRGRPAGVKTGKGESLSVKSDNLIKPEVPSLVNTIVTNARKGSSIRAKAANHSSKVSARQAANSVV